MAKQDKRLFRVITVALLAGILCLLIMLYNRSVATNTPAPINPQTQQQSEQDQAPSYESTPQVQSI